MLLPDIDECLTNTHKCSRHADCMNTDGKYKCKCKQGFRGSGFECSGEKCVPLSCLELKLNIINQQECKTSL